MNDVSILAQPVENKTLVWFESNNEYLVLEPKTAHIITQLHQGESDVRIAENLAKDLDVPYEKAIDFVIELKEELYLPKLSKKEKFENDYKDVKKPTSWGSIKHYKINEQSFQVNFENEELLSLIHPKFAHLEIDSSTTISGLFEVFFAHSFIILFVDDVFIGDWSRKEQHYFQGKFSMELIQKIHHLPESEWVGIFHASAVAKDEKSILFLGDSGNGKSTSLALLQAHGFDCLADDFVPFAKNNRHVYSFPSAISIKKTSLPTLLPFYPSLENASEFHFKSLHKIVRYLPPHNKNEIVHLPCSDLVFIKYDQNTELEFYEISKIEAFEKLIPDSWLSPIKENVACFFEWFSSVNCYQLTYSNNQKMIEKVNQLFSNDL